MTYECVCRCLFDIVILVHGYEQHKLVSCFSKWYLLLPLDVKLFFVEYLKQDVELFSLTHISCMVKTASLLG